jgi:putative tryptophan/tyrosine transport system substrate-binding protein
VTGVASRGLDEVLMRRRAFIAGLAGIAGVPFAVRAQHPATAAVGLLSSVAFETRREQVAAFLRGLNESGFVAGQNVGIEYRSADNQAERLPALAADLVDRRVNVIVTIGGDIPIRAAMAATATTPIVFVTGGDPIKNGFVASLNRPGGNLTGINFLVNLLVAKRLELLHEVTPAGAPIGVLVNPANPNAGPGISDARTAAQGLGRKLVVAQAASEADIDAAFATLAKEKVGAVMVEADPFFLARLQQILTLTTAQALPAVYSFREFAVSGGLMSYGSSLADAYRQAGIYGGRILKGEKPANLPVQQSTKVELIINLMTAKALGLTFPLSLLGRADEVIE